MAGITSENDNQMAFNGSLRKKGSLWLEASASKLVHLEP